MRQLTSPLMLVGVLAVYAAMAGCSKEVPFDDLLGRAEDALARGDSSAAVVDIKAALQQQPENAAARRLLGEIYLFQQQGAAAVEELERSLRSSFDAATARTLAQALFRTGDHQRLIDLENEGFFDRMASDGEYLAVVARSLAMLGDLNAAREILERARAASPANAYVRFTAAEFQARADLDITGATTALRQLLAVHNDLAEAWGLLGSLFLAQGLYENAVTAFSRVVELNPYQLRERLNLANVQLQTGDWDAARAQSTILARAAPKNPGINYLQARIALHDGKPEEALDELNTVLSVAPAHTPSLFLAAALNAENGAYSSALNQLGTLLQAQPEQHGARLLLARVFLQENNAEKAADAARRVLEAENANLEALKILGVAAALQNEHTEAADAFARAAALDPEALETRLRLGAELLQAERFAEARDVLAEARAAWPDDLRARVRQVQTEVLAGRTAEALTVAEAAVTDFPEDPVAYDLLGQVKLSLDDRAGATELFNRALEMDSDDRVARNGLAALEMSEDDAGVARRLFREVLAAEPGDLESLTALPQLEAYQQDFASIEDTLREALTDDPDSLLPRLQYARAALRNNNPEDAVDTLTEVRDAHGQDPRLYYLLAQGYQRLGESEAAGEASNRLIELAPKAPEALRLAAGIATAQGDFATAEAHLRTALSSTDAPAFRSALVEILVRQGKLAEARLEMEKLPPAAQASEPMQMLAGAVALRERDLEAARGHYEAAYDAAPATRNVIAIAAIDWAGAKYDDALARLEEWLVDNPDDALALNQLAMYQLALGREEDATNSYQLLLGAAPESAVALNNLAWLYRESDTQKALEYVDRALASAPDVGPILDTKAMILHHAGRAQEALRVMEDAIEASGENPAFMLNKATILAGAGRAEEAREIVSSLPPEGPADYTRALESLKSELGSG